MTTANLLVVLLVGTVVGALAGWALGPLFPHSLYLGIVAGFLATIIAGVVRNTIMTRITSSRPGHFKHSDSRDFIFGHRLPCR